MSSTQTGSSIALPPQDFEVLFENAQIGLMYISGDRVLIRANRKLANLFGYSSPEEMVGLSMRSLHLCEENYLNFGEQYFKTLVDGVQQDIEYQLLKKDGTIFWVSASGKVLDNHIPADLSKGVLWSIQDISDRKKAELDVQIKQRQISGIFHAAPIGIGFLIDRCFQEVNEEFCKLIGYTREELIGRNSRMIYPSDAEYDRVAQVKYPQMAATGKGSIETVMQKKTGEKITVYLSSAYLDRSNANSGSTFTVLDLSSLKTAEEQLKLQATVLDQIHDHVTVTDLEGNILYVNQSEIIEIGHSKEDIIGKNVSVYGDHPDADAEQAEIVKKTIEHGRWSGEVINFTEEGEKLVLELRTTLIKNQQDEPMALVGVGSDITERKLAEEQIKFMAYYDVLTGLPNRELFSDRMKQAISMARRTNKKLAICYLDLDGFKPINDQFGHDIGDQLLIDLSNRLQNYIREEDTIARIGGDEFVILMNDLDNIIQCEDVLHRLLGVISNPFNIAQRRLHISASIGVTVYPNDSSSPDELLRHADQAMYLAKESGKNKYRLYDPVQDQKAQAFRKAILEFVVAIRHSQLELHYQPRVDLRTGELASLEALVRWHHPDKGLLFPDEFLPMISGSPLEIELDEWVLKTALDQHMKWRDQGVQLAVSVNISPRHIQQSTFPGYLRQLLENYPESMSGFLELEILETSALGDTAHVAKIMKDCAELGVTFSLDDFGTGYSSLTYFSRLPISTLKIDQHFVREMLDDPQEQDIVEGVLRLAEALKRPVVAEGVESIELGFMLTQLGCQYAQGYGIARPMPGQSVLRWHENWKVEGLWHGLHKEVLGQEMSYDLLVSVYSHRLWISRVRQYFLSGQETEKPELKATDCQFSRWYKGIGKTRYGKRPSFALIQTKHEEIHEFVETLLNRMDEKKPKQIDRALSNLELQGSQLINLLIQLSKE